MIFCHSDIIEYSKTNVEDATGHNAPINCSTVRHQLDLNPSLDLTLKSFNYHCMTAVAARRRGFAVTSSTAVREFLPL